MHTERDVWQQKGIWKIRPYTPYVKKEWIQAMSDILSTNSLSDFGIREQFEEKLAKYCGCKYAVAVNSGTNAMLIGMIALGIKSIVGPNYGNNAWVSCCRFLKIDYQTVDVRRDNFCLNESKLKDHLLCKKSDAVMYVNHGGYTGPQLRAIKNICETHRVKLFEDSCNALGQWYDGKHAGTFGDIGFISFGVPKLLSCGEGGAILINDKKTYEKCKELAYHGGWYDDLEHSRFEIGLNFVMPMQNAHFLSTQLDDIDELLEMREKVCNRYESNGIKIRRFHQAPSMYEYETSKPVDVMRAGNLLSIQFMYKHYKAHGRYVLKGLNTKISEIIENRIILLPNSLDMSDTDVDMVCAAIKMGEK